MSLLLVAVLCFSVVLVACGDNTATPATNQDNQGQNAQVSTGVSSALAGSFPDTTAFYLTLNTDTSSDQIKSWQKMVDYLSAIPEVKVLFSNADLLALAKLGTYDTDIKPWIGKELALGVTDLNAIASMVNGATSGSGAAAPSGDIPVLLAASVTDQAKADAFVTSLSGKIGLQPTKDTYKGANLYSFNAGFFTVSAAVAKDKLFIGGGDAIVKAALDRTADKSLSSNAQYKAVSEKLPKGNLGYAYLDFQTIVKALNSNPQAKQFTDSLKSTSLDYAGGLGLTFATADEGFRIDAYQTYLTDKTPKAVADQLGKGANPNNILKAIPEKSIFFLNSRDAASSYDMLINSLKSMGSTAGTSTDVDKSIAEFETATGLSIKNDIVSLFSGEFGLFVTPQPDNKTVPVGVGLVADAGDKAATQAKLDKITAAVEKSGEGKIKFESKTNGSTTYKRAADQVSGSDVTINLGIAGNYVFFTVGDGATADLITSATGGKSILDGVNSANFNKVKSVLPGSNQGYVYVDIQGVTNLATAAIPAEQSKQVKNYTDKLTKLYSLGSATTQTVSGSYTTVYIYFPVMK